VLCNISNAITAWQVLNCNNKEEMLAIIISMALWTQTLDKDDLLATTIWQNLI
jgi:hypothetical protein